MGAHNFLIENRFDELFVSPPPDTLECPICLSITNQAVQTACGHIFCEACILKTVREGRPNCPVDNYELDETKIFADHFTRKEISNLDVRCIKSPEGCPWVGKLKCLEEHTEDCPFQEIVCPNDCRRLLLRQELTEHFLVCEKRLVNCQYCDIKIVFRMLDGHYKNCQRFMLTCPNYCGISVARDELDGHLINSCPETILKCAFKNFGCLFEGNREIMKIHDEASQNLHFKHVVEALGRISTAHEQSKQESRLEINRLTNRVKELENNRGTASKRGSDTDLEKDVEKLFKLTNDNKDAIHKIEARTWRESVIWTIENFEEQFRNAKQDNTISIHSHAFYTTVPGYKMCCRMNPNGIESGKGTHLSLFIHIMKGEYDDVISWPFRGDLTLTILDQGPSNEKHNVTEKLVAHSSLKAFRRPQSNKNSNGYGFATMISHQKLTSNNYIKNDRLMIKIKVETP